MFQAVRLFFSDLRERLRYTLGYFGDNSNLHGMSYVLSLKPIPVFQRIFWLFILIASGVCASAILRQALNLYSGSSVSYLVETNYLTFDTLFPAVTICEQLNNGASYDRIKAYIQRNNLPSSQMQFLKDTAFWNVKVCKSCNDCTNTTCLEDFAHRIDSMRAQCKELLTDCWWDGKPLKCCERFMPLESEYGVCFTFNSRLSNEFTFTVNRTTSLPVLIFSATQEIGIRVHSPDDMVSVGMENILGRPFTLPLITDFEVILSVEETVSDQSITTMSPHVRGCLFKNERPAFAKQWPSSRYSFSTCVLYCRALNQLQLCNCTHHLMPKMDGIPPCNIEGLRCLYKNKDSLGSNSCDCPMSCEEINYKPIHMFLDRHMKPSPELAKRGTRGIVKLAQLPSSRVRRTAIRQLMGLVVDIGGVGGVFFSASLLSVIEIVYLCCMRRNRHRNVLQN